MKTLYYKILWVVLLLPFVSSYGQSDSKYFYYYQGKKVFLEPDKQTIAISWEGDPSTAKLTSLASAAKGKFSSFAQDHTRNMVITVDKNTSLNKDLKLYYFEITLDATSTAAGYESQIASYRSMTNVIMASPCFKFPNGKKMGLSNNLYVKLKNASDVNLLYEQATKMHLEVLGYNQFMPLWFTLSCNKKTTVNALAVANVLYETGLFESAEPEFMYHDLAASNDTDFSSQWGLKNTGQYGNAFAGIDTKAEKAWNITTGSPDIKVAVFDHGFEMNHPDLQANTYGTGYDANSGTSPAQVRGSHGTACAGIIGAVQNNNLGVSGIAPKSKLISISINLFFSDTPQSLANGFNWAWQNGADVISNSWGGYEPSSIIDDAITNTFTNGRGGRGTVIVFAAGNENNTNIRYPGNSNPQILLVGALSPCGERKNPGSCDGEGWGSCFGSKLDIMAPGVKIATTDRQGNNGYTATDYTLTFNGTSSACPFAAGVAALILSVNPELTVQQVTDIIEKTAQKTRTDLYNYGTTPERPNGTWSNEMGYGLINAYEAVAFAKSLDCEVDLTITENVAATFVDYKQASNSIIAKNIINSGAKATYHAGSKVILPSGFKAVAGATFKAYIEGCAKKPTVHALASSGVIDYDYESNDDAEADKNQNTLKIIQNASSGRISIQSSAVDVKKSSIMVYDMVGNKVYTTPRQQVVNENQEIDLSSYPPGIYIVVLKTEKSTQQKKFIWRK
jgi:subtilisin family serine protease